MVYVCTNCHICTFSKPAEAKALWKEAYSTLHLCTVQYTYSTEAVFLDVAKGGRTPNGSLNVSSTCIPIFRCLYHIKIDISKYRKARQTSV